MNKLDNWMFSVACGISLLNFLEQNFSGSEMKVALEGFFIWAELNKMSYPDVVQYVKRCGGLCGANDLTAIKI